MKKVKKETSGNYDIMRSVKGGAHVEKGKRPKDKQRAKHNLKRGVWED